VGTNVGTPVAYYGLRMLDESTAVAAGSPRTDPQPLRLTVVTPGCATGQRPTNHDLTEGEAVELELAPRLAADDYFVIRQSLRVFQHYVSAITGGALWLEPQLAPVAGCVTVGFHASPPYAGIDDANAAIDMVSAELQAATDVWWVLYPPNVPSDPRLDDLAHHRRHGRPGPRADVHHRRPVAHAKATAPRARSIYRRRAAGLPAAVAPARVLSPPVPHLARARPRGERPSVVRSEAYLRLSSKAARSARGQASAGTRRTAQRAPAARISSNQRPSSASSMAAAALPIAISTAA
jgi:hypothetical protein